MTHEDNIDNPWGHLLGRVSSTVASVTGVDVDRAKQSIEVPPDPILGDLSTTVAFSLARELRESPVRIAEDFLPPLEEQVSSEALLERVERKGPYINFFIDRSSFAPTVIGTVAALGDAYGRTTRHAERRALIEYPAVNPSKPWHIGHTRNAVLGDTLANTLEWVGYEVVRVDYINDLGLQIAQLTWRLKKGDDGPAQGVKYDHYLGRLYVGVQEAFETDAAAQEEIREVARRLEDPTSDEARLSREMVTRCVRAQCQTAYRLGIYHHYQVWESSIAHSGLLERAKEVLLSCDNIEQLEEGEKKGCIVVRLDTLEEFKDLKDPYKVLFRSDGTRTYTGADVAFQMWKFGILEDPFRYEPFEEQPNGEVVYRTSLEGDKREIGRVDEVYNVIASAQAHPQRLIYTILDLLGYHEQSERSHHIAYEFVGLEDADFSGRKGTWIGYTCDEVLDRARELARQEVEKRNPDASEEFKDSVAESVGVGAVRYMLLKASPDRKITFRWSEALDFNGDSAPYLQYSYARSQRILERAGGQTGQADLSVLTDDPEFNLLKALARFPQTVIDVVAGLKKGQWGTSFSCNRLAGYAYDLATLYNKFYDVCPVLRAEEPLRSARVELVRAFNTTMRNVLGLIGVPAIERM